MKKLVLAAAVVVGMFALVAQAETYYLCHGTDYMGDPKSKPSMNGTSGCAGWDTSPSGDAQVLKDAAAKIAGGNTYCLLGQIWYKKNGGNTYDEQNSADMRTPSGDYTIPDDAQIVFQGGRINLKNGNGKTLTIPNLTVKPATTQSAFNVGDDKATVTLKGANWVVEAGAVLGFNVTAEAGSTPNPRALDIQSTIVGTGTLLFYSNPEFLSYETKLKNTSTFTLNGDFSGFTGAYEFLGNDRFTAVVKDAKSFAGINTPKVVLNSVLRQKATAGIMLSFECDVTTGPNCVWDFGTDVFSTTVTASDTTFSKAYQKTITASTTPATIDVAANKTLTIEGPITGTIGLNKTGAGTLVFTHPAFAEPSFTLPTNFTGTTSISDVDMPKYVQQIDDWVASAGFHTLALDSYVWDGSALAATLTREGTLPVDVYVCYGATDGGTDENAWDHCEKLSASFGAGDVATLAVVQLPSEAAYLSFFTPKDGWLDTLTVADLTLTQDPKVKLSAPTAGEVGIAGVQFSVGVNGLGTGAKSADLFAVYGHGDSALTTNKIATATELGIFNFSLSGLKPATAYSVSVFATNGLAGGFAQTDPVVVTTLAEESALATDSVFCDGTTLSAVLTREGADASDVYACYGAVYGGAETSGWEHCEKVGVFPAGVSIAPGVVIPSGARYVRFFSEKDGWSETVFLPELPIAGSEAPVFGVTAQGIVRETSAHFMGYLAALGEDATSVEIIAAYGATADAADGEQTVAAIDAEAFDPSEPLEFDLLGLKPGSHYFVKFHAKNDQGEVSATSEAFELNTVARGTIGATVLAPSSDDSNVAVQSETRDLATGERVIEFSVTSTNNTDTPEPAVFRVTTPGYAEVLVVGGGGAGGCYTTQTGGGGGAGGFQHFESMYFEPGDYLMAVGPGAIAWGDNGPSGRKSTITLGSTVLVEALGGDGGRRSNNDGTQTKLTDKKSSGGGKIGYHKDKDGHPWVNLGTPGQGNDGGNGFEGNNFGGSGGGGAGAPGGDAVIIDGVKTCGSGGDGLPCAITGETLYYAGGGGGAGAGNDVVSGRGGLGGGGGGTSGGAAESYNDRATRNAVNGLGGGGGGGGNGGNSAVDATKANLPGNGGSGTIILRFVPEDSTLAEHPVAQLNAITPKNDANDVPGVDVSYRIVSEGAGKLVTVDFEYGTDINSFRSVRFSDGAFVGTCEENFTGLRANVTYYGRLKVTDEKGTVAYSRVLSFTTLDGDDSSVDQTAPRFSDVSYGTTNRQHKVEFTATGTNFALAAGATAVKLLVGADPGALAEVPVTVASLTDEAVTVFCDAVDFDTPYYGALVVDNGDFLTQSPVLAFTVSGASVLLSSAASASADSQRTLVFSGVVKSLGAGETTAKLYLSTANANSLELAQTIAVTATGSFEFAPVTFEWDQTAYYRIDVENSFQDKKWTSAGTAGNKGAYDYAGYRWIPADDDGVHLWTDAANWEQTTDHAPGKGYPSGNAGNNGSVAYFPAMGYEYVVDVNGGNVASANVIPSENARIRFRSATGNGWSGILNGKFSWAKNESMVFDGFSATLGQNTTSSLTTSNSFALVNGSSFRTGFYSAFRMDATGIAVYVDPTSQLGPFTQGKDTVATVGGTDAEVILEGCWSIGVINVFGSGTTLGKGVIFRGSKAQMTMGHANARLRGTATNTAEAPSMPFVFEVPVDGYENVPVSSARTDHGLLFDSGTVTLKVSADSPAVLAETDGVYPLVSAVNGIKPEGFLLGELPHPDTDRWILTYDNTDATTGTLLTGIGVRLVGYPSEPTAPVARGLHVKESAADAVTFAADFRCGGTSPSATWSYWLDAETAAQARAIDTFTGVENFGEFSVDGLEKGTQHVLHLKGVSAGGESVVDYDFGTVGDWAVLGAVEGVAAEPYGPYTKLIADAGTEGVFKVLVACAAEISFDDGEAEAFTLNTGTYTVKGGALANEAGAIAELDGAETLTIKVQTRAVENEPLIDVVTAPTAFGDRVTIPLTVLGLGGELTRAPDNPVTAVAAKLVWGYHPEHLVYETDLGTVGPDAVEAGVTNLAITTLPRDTFFYAKVIADNGEADGVGMSHLFTFWTISCGDGMLYQASKKGYNTLAWNVIGDASCVLVPGGPQAALHGNKSNGMSTSWSDADGKTISWDGGSMYGYVGYIHLQAMNYAFVAGIDDNCRMRIYASNANLSALADETTLFDSGANFDGNSFKPQLFTCPREGWYAVEIRVGDRSGQYGPNSETRKLRYCELGNRVTAPAENDASWRDLVDSGDGTLFSTFLVLKESLIYDETAPVVSNAVADVSQGDRMTVSCAAEGAAAFSMLIGGDMAMSDWAEVEVEVEGEGDERVFTLANLTPGTNFWWQLVATGANGVRFATVPQHAEMMGAASFASGPSVTPAQDTLKVTGEIEPGAGENWAFGTFTVGGVTTTVVLGCWTNGVDRAPFGLNWSQTFANAWNETVAYAITLSNGVNGVSWTSEPVTGEKTLADTATYTWTATGDAGAAWNDPANWQCSTATGIGYPTETSTAKFTAVDGADVVLDQNRTVKTFTVDANARIVFSGPFTFTAPGTGEWNFNLAGVTLGAKDGATFRHAGTFFATAENQTFLADNATLHFNNFYTCKDTGKSTANCTIRLSGEAPLFLSQGGFGPRLSSADYTFVLNVPERGWTEPVIRSNGLTKQVKFGATDQSDARTTKFRFAIDPDSPFLKRGTTKRMVIVDWPYGFSADNIDLDPVYDARKARKCGLSLNDEDPAAATLLKLTLCGHGGLIVFIH